MIHRDYIAHAFRWTHAIKLISPRINRGVNLLDVGCGREMPLAMACYSNMLRLKRYIGVDVGRFDIPEAVRSSYFPVWRHEGDIARMNWIGPKPNFITCYEMLEHVEFAHARRTLKKLRSIAAPDAIFSVSTPCWDGKNCAKNHVNELKYEVMGALLEETGWEIKNWYGTFINQRDLRQVCDHLPNGDLIWHVFMQLHDYYDSCTLSTIFAPLFPAAARNVIWDCVPATKRARKHFKRLKSIPKPWGSSS